MLVLFNADVLVLRANTFWGKILTYFASEDIFLLNQGRPLRADGKGHQMKHVVGHIFTDMRISTKIFCSIFDVFSLVLHKLYLWTVGITTTM